MKLALYTIGYQGLWSADEALPLENLIPKISDMGYDGMSLSAKRPHGSVLDLDGKARKHIKELANSSQLELVAVESYSDYMDPITERREANLVWVKEQIQLASDLGMKLVKIFPGWKGTIVKNGRAEYGKLFHYGYPYAGSFDRWIWIRDGIKDSLKWAKEYGVTLVLQNHGPPFRPGYEDCLEMIREIGTENLKMCLDIGVGCFEESEQTDDYIEKAVQACKDVLAYSHFNGKFKKMKDGTVVQAPYEMTEEGPSCGAVMNYESFVKYLQKIGFGGYLAYEVCGPVHVNHEMRGTQAVDDLSRLALDYMRQLIQGGMSKQAPPMITP